MCTGISQRCYVNTYLYIYNLIVCRSEKFGRGLREIGVEAKQRVVMFAETRSVFDFDSELIC